MSTDNDLTNLRDRITEALTTAGIKAYPNMPDRLHPPLALAQPGDPYLEPGPAAGFGAGSWAIHHEVVLLVAPGDNRAQTRALDRLIEDAVNALGTNRVQQVGQPYVLAIKDGGEYLAARITLTDTL
ncbi:hypothetical protein [Curtobacterium sp. PhB146]|uniref:hypothetical protein n=1 Tax=Curtobacterium sp. PhB146 TaxID=2485187 RepID=UPI0010453AA2|nr:hypothetical protein [Curtobacterium sp. PhB146]TCU48343.1 hypothetical protein EDF33_102234 [Curtobacterium sp. PhB146]